MCLVKPVYGFCSLLAIKILVPDNVRIIFLPLSLNSFCSIILLITYFYHLIRGKETLRYLHNYTAQYILMYIIFSLFVTLFANYTPFEMQIHNFFMYLFLQIIPIIMMIAIIRTPHDLCLITNVFVFSFIICTLYGIICFVMGLPYPYNSWFANYFDVARGANYDQIEEMAGISGRIIGTSTSDSWAFGMVVGIAFMISFIINNYKKSKTTLVCCLLCIIAVFFTVRRTPILTFFSFFILLFFFSQKSRTNFYRVLRYSFVVVIAALLLIYYVPFFAPFKNIIETVFFFWDDSVALANDVGGSSFEYRLFQLKYTINHVADSPLFGMGWGAMYYKGAHPDMNGWESIIFTTLFQSGYLGVVFTAGLFWAFYRYSIVRSRNRALAKAFILSSLVFCIVNDTIYPFYIYFGCVLLNKLSTIGLSDKTVVI